MSYAGTRCNCGERKLPDTLICQACESAFSETPELEKYRRFLANRTYNARAAAIGLLSMSRRRKFARRRNPK